MVKIGFICEGDTEVKVVKSDEFQQWLGQIGLACVLPIEDARGNGNLLPHNIDTHRKTLFKAGAKAILILTDLDKENSIDAVQQRIGNFSDQHIIVSVKQLEAWFLADSQTLGTLLGESFTFDKPETDANPYETIRQLFIDKTGRGIGTKPMLARRMLKYGFSLERAAAHPNCPSARYFLTKLQTIASATF